MVCDYSLLVASHVSNAYHFHQRIILCIFYFERNKILFWVWSCVRMYHWNLILVWMHLEDNFFLWYCRFFFIILLSHFLFSFFWLLLRGTSREKWFIPSVLELSVTGVNYKEGRQFWLSLEVLVCDLDSMAVVVTHMAWVCGEHTVGFIKSESRRGEVAGVPLTSQSCPSDPIALPWTLSLVSFSNPNSSAIFSYYSDLSL